MQNLALQIGQIDGIEIHQADRSDAGRGKIKRDWRAEAARAYQQHT